MSKMSRTEQDTEQAFEDLERSLEDLRRALVRDFALGTLFMTGEIPGIVRRARQDYARFRELGLEVEALLAEA